MPVATCQTTAQCGAGQICDPVTSSCESFRPTPPSNNANFGRRDTGSGGAPGSDAGSDGGSDGVDDTGPSPETGPSVVPCTPACAPHEACQEGECVSACSPGCEEPTICAVDGCRIPDCTVRGAPCDPSRPSQGGFTCVTIPDPDGGPDTGVCGVPCDTPFEAAGCALGEYCWDVGTTAEVNVCISSECDADADCSTGSCIDFDHDFAVCLRSGATAEGQSCDADANGCIQGTYCRRLSSGSSAGVCSRLCDPWASSTDCPGGQACGHLFTTRQGLCTDALDATGDQPYVTCTTPGTTCGDATRCLSAATTNFCYKYCRPGSSDCQGVMPDGSDGACDNFLIPGDRTLGLCMPACDPQVPNDCGTDALCVDRVCRQTCATGNAVDDCCGGSTPCGFSCVNNLCE